MTGREGANQNRGCGCPHIPVEKTLDSSQQMEESGPWEGGRNTKVITDRKFQGKREYQEREGGQIKRPRKAKGIELLRNPGTKGAGDPGRAGSGVCILLQLTRSLPPLASRFPSVLKLQQFTGPVCPWSSVPQGKSSAFCGSVSNCLGHSRTVKSSALKIRREQNSLRGEARQALRPETKAIKEAKD